MSHVNLKINIMITGAIAKHFGDLVITRGKNHTFLGIDIELLDDNKLVICMKSYIQEAIIFFMIMCPKTYFLQKIRICKKLIQTPLYYQIITQNIFIP